MPRQRDPEALGENSLNWRKVPCHKGLSILVALSPEGVPVLLRWLPAGSNGGGDWAVTEMTICPVLDLHQKLADNRPSERKTPTA